MLYEYINNESDLQEFVQRLNELSHFDKYQLINNVFKINVVTLNIPELPRKNKVSHQRWWFSIGDKYQCFVTFRINSKLPIERPTGTGVYEKIHFHLNENDISGISQN